MTLTFIYDSEKDISKRIRQSPGIKEKYGSWTGEKGNSNFVFRNSDNTDFHNRVETIMKAHNATYVPYKKGQVDFDHFSVFTVDVEVSSKRTITHPNTNKEIARKIVEHNGDYNKMYSKNIMGIASGSQRSQEMAKNVIESLNEIAGNPALSESARISAVHETLNEKQKEFKQTIHEENLVKGKQKNKTQWVDTDINHQFGHLGGTSEAKRQELEKSKCKSK